jgi:hypothetical protein
MRGGNKISYIHRYRKLISHKQNYLTIISFEGVRILSAIPALGASHKGV